MQTEIEAKWLRIDPQAIRAKLREAGAALIHPERLMVRKVYDFPDLHLQNEENAWVRVRDEGDKITMSFKQIRDRTVTGTSEITLTIDSFEAADHFLRALGLTEKSHQETKRESWKLDGCEIEIDTWPWIPTFIEIEAQQTNYLENAATALGLTMSNALHGGVEPAYQDIFKLTEKEIDELNELKFAVPPPSWVEERRK